MNVKAKCPVCAREITIPIDNFLVGRDKLIGNKRCPCGYVLNIFASVIAIPEGLASIEENQ
jgi:hypothetical protein